MSWTIIKSGKHEYPMHQKLIRNLERLKKANKRDWDFKIIISGDGMTRTGKTTKAGQLGYYFDPNSTEKNWCYDGRKLISLSKKLGRNAVLCYDEARESLDSKKSMSKYSQGIVDYFNECGYLNQYLIIILPDFFDLNKSVALNLSICLINCKVRGDFYRGYFDFYSRKDKRKLYVKGKKFMDYSVQKATFDGTFTDYFPYDYKALEKLKEEAAQSRNKEKEKKPKYLGMLHKAAWKLRKEHLWKQKDIGDLLEITMATVKSWQKKYENIEIINH